MKKFILLLAAALAASTALAQRELPPPLQISASAKLMNSIHENENALLLGPQVEFRYRESLGEHPRAHLVAGIYAATLFNLRHWDSPDTQAGLKAGIGFETGEILTLLPFIDVNFTFLPDILYAKPGTGIEAQFTLTRILSLIAAGEIYYKTKLASKGMHIEPALTMGININL